MILKVDHGQINCKILVAKASMRGDPGLLKLLLDVLGLSPMGLVSGVFVAFLTTLGYLPNATGNSSNHNWQ